MNPKIENQVKELSFALYEPNYEVRAQHFTFIYYKNRILTVGRNNKKTNPVNLKNFKSQKLFPQKGTCSELNAFLKLKNRTNIDFSKVILVNTRVDNNREIALSKPCQFCENLIRYIGPKEVYFTNSLGNFEKHEV